METQNKISLEKCRELVANSQKYSDTELLSIRDRLYRLAEVAIEKFDKLKSFIIQTHTIAAKARIVQ